MKDGEKDIELLAVDANAILQAVLGGRAVAIFRKLEKTTEFHTPAPMLDEVLEYLPILAHKRNITVEDAFIALSSLPLQVQDYAFYRKSYNQAWKRIHKKDPDDVPLLALALTLNCPIWTNNLKDFQGCGVQLYNTENLLRLLKLLT